MNWNELKVRQEKAFEVYSKIYSLNFNSEKEVLFFLEELLPYLKDRNISLPKDHLYLLLNRYGYGENVLFCEGSNRTKRKIRNIIIDVEMEDFLYTHPYMMQRKSHLHQEA